MKMKMTIEAAEIKALIRESLARNGLEVVDADITFSKNKVFVETDAVLPSLTSSLPTASIGVATVTGSVHTSGTVTAGPILEVVSDNTPMDMDAILAASQNVTRNKPPPFKESDRQLMKGESYDFPHGDK